MPILSHETAPPTTGGRVIRLPGLPDFNAGDPAFKINAFEGWFDGPTPVPVLVANGGGPGAVAVGDWDPAEAYYVISGRVDVSSVDRAAMRQMLLAAFPYDREVTVAVIGNELDADRQVFVRLYDKPTFPPGEKVLRFTLPLVAPDPLKYDLTPLTGTVGVFSGADWYRTYTDDGAGGWYRTYTDDGAGGWYRTYAQPEAMSERPLAWGVTSPGDEVSRRLVTTVYGPQEAGWRLQRSDATGVVAEALQVDLALTEGQTVTVDSAARTARLGGADVSHLAFGDFPTLPPDASVFRLVAPTDLGGWADFEALPAYY